MARRRQGGKKRGSLVGTLVFALALLLMWLGSELGLVSWGGGGAGMRHPIGAMFRLPPREP